MMPFSAKQGTLFFTDPAYGMEFRYDDPTREMDFTGVFRITARWKVITLLTDPYRAPNGIGLSPDESKLYVANSGRASGLIWEVFDRAPDGSYTNERLFYDAGPAGDSLRGAPDGLVVRSDGIIFATGPGGVWIFDPEGEHLGIVRTGQATSNCTLDAEETVPLYDCRYVPDAHQAALNEACIKPREGSRVSGIRDAGRSLPLHR